jgi:hypothetical protein
VREGEAYVAEEPFSTLEMVIRAARRDPRLLRQRVKAESGDTLFVHHADGCVE